MLARRSRGPRTGSALLAPRNASRQRTDHSGNGVIHVREIVVQGVWLEEGSCDVHCDRLRTRRHCHSWPRSTPRPRWRGLAVRRPSFSLTPAGRPQRSGLCVTRPVRGVPVGSATRWGSQLRVGAAGGVLEAPAVDAEGTSPELSGAETRKISGEIIRSIASTQACQAPHWD